MPLFCDKCSNLLISESTADKFYYRCTSCEITVEPTDEDTLQYEENTNVDFGIYELLKTAGQDPLNPKVEKTCPKCEHQLSRQVRLGPDMRLINICIKCNYNWPDLSV